MNILPASEEHIPFLLQYDRHIAEKVLRSLVGQERILVAVEDGRLCGWLRWNLFWDNTPFLNLIYLLEPYRGKGFGTKMMDHWEQEMKGLGFETVMTSTASDEYAQHFYRKLGYTAIGGFTPFGDPYELIFAKKL